MKRKKVLLFGSSGFLGSHILKFAPKNAEMVLAYRKNPARLAGFRQVRIDLTNADLLNKKLREIRPEIIVCAARFDPFDEDPGKTKKFVRVLTKSARTIGAKLVYISSDAVFDGKKGNYREQDKPRPVTSYGKAKLAAETAIQENLKDKFVIVRPSYIYSDDPTILDKRTIDLVAQINKGKSVFRFVDMYRSPIRVTDLAAAIWRVIEKDFIGLVHVAGKRQNIFAFTRKLLKDLGFKAALLKPDLFKNSKVKLARDTSLNSSLAKKLLS